LLADIADSGGVNFALFSQPLHTQQTNPAQQKRHHRPRALFSKNLHCCAPI
jgi:hypothetical protein